MKNRKLLLGLVVFILSCVGFTNANAEDNKWIPLGPNNISGRTRAILVDRFNSNVLFAGSVSGGLYISTNDGKSWNELSLNNGENIAITALAQDNNGNIYVGTGEGFYGSNFGRKDVSGQLGNGVYMAKIENKNWTNNFHKDSANLKAKWAQENIKFNHLAFTKPVEFNQGDGRAFINKIACNYLTNDVYVATNAGLKKLNSDASNWSDVTAVSSSSKVHDIKISKKGVMAVTFKDSFYKICISGENNEELVAVLTKNELKDFDTAVNDMNRAEIAFGNKNSDNLFAYISYKDTLNRQILLSTNINSIQWVRNTAKDFYAGSETDYAMSIYVDDYSTPEFIYLGGDNLYKGFKNNAGSDFYSWGYATSYFANKDADNYISKNVHNIIKKESNDTVFTMIATDGGVHIYSFNEILNRNRWHYSSKGMNTSMAYSVAIAPDASIVGGTYSNGSIYIPVGESIGANKYGDVIWNINSNGYEPKTPYNFVTNGGMSAASGFYRIAPSIRKSLILSRPFTQIARTYGHNNDFSTIDDQTWHFDASLFTIDFLSSSVTSRDPSVTPLALWESTDAKHLKDTISVRITTKTLVKGIGEKELVNITKPGTSDVVPACIFEVNDTIILTSPSMEYPFEYVFDENDTVYVNENKEKRVTNPIQSRLALGNARGVYICDRINDYTKSPSRWARVKPFSNNLTSPIASYIRNLAFSADGKILYVATEVIERKETGIIEIRYILSKLDISDINFNNASFTQVTDFNSVPVIFEKNFTRPITSISIDKNDTNNIILTFGDYMNETSTNIQVSTDAGNTFKEITNWSPEEGIEILTKKQPVYSALIEGMKTSSSKVYIGTDKGVYYTDNFKSDLSSNKINWYKMEDIPNVPVFDLKQQITNLPKYTFYTTSGLLPVLNIFEATELPGAIYAATYGKGFFACLDNVVEQLPEVSIKNIKSDNNKTELKIYPNPTNDLTYINYTLSAASNVTLKVFDMSGRLVSTFDKGRQGSGNHTITMNCAGMKKGIYVIQILTGNTSSTAKLVIQ